MNSFTANLHIHTVLSPCGDIVMTPANIIKTAVNNGLDIIAIADHNSAKNVAVTMELSQKEDLTVIPGMEVESKEEVHLLCLFSELEGVLQWQEIVYDNLPNLENDEEFFGPQLITDINDEFIAREKRLLLTAVNLTIREIITEVRRLGGIVIPAHIDKTNNSILSNLGFIPPELQLVAVEITSKEKINYVNAKIGKQYQYIVNSDAHYLKDIRPTMHLKIKKPKLEEIVDVLREKRDKTLKLL